MRIEIVARPSKKQLVLLSILSTAATLTTLKLTEMAKARTEEKERQKVLERLAKKEQEEGFYDEDGRGILKEDYYEDQIDALWSCLSELEKLVKHDILGEEAESAALYVICEEDDEMEDDDEEDLLIH